MGMLLDAGGREIKAAATAVVIKKPDLPKNEADAFLELIERAARDETVDVDKMERLMQMRERVVMQRAEQEFNSAMRDAQAKMPRVWRNKASDTGRWATLEAIDVASRPIITEHGFAESYGTTDSPLKEHYRIICLVSHVGGFSRPYQADVPTDMLGPKGAAVKTAIHGFGSSMSYGRRYLKALIWNIVLTDEDDDGKAAGGKPPRDVITDDQVIDLRDLLLSTESDEKLFLEHMKLASLGNIFADKFEDAKKIITETAQRRAARASNMKRDRNGR